MKEKAESEDQEEEEEEEEEEAEEGRKKEGGGEEEEEYQWAEARLGKQSKDPQQSFLCQPDEVI